MEDCCKNLDRRDETQLRPDLVVSVCRDCGRRHFELTIDPGELGLVGKAL